MGGESADLLLAGANQSYLPMSVGNAFHEFEFDLFEGVVTYVPVLPDAWAVLAPVVSEELLGHYPLHAVFDAEFVLRVLLEATYIEDGPVVVVEKRRQVVIVWTWSHMPV